MDFYSKPPQAAFGHFLPGRDGDGAACQTFADAAALCIDIGNFSPEKYCEIDPRSRRNLNHDAEECGGGQVGPLPSISILARPAWSSVTSTGVPLTVRDIAQLALGLPNPSDEQR